MNKISKMLIDVAGDFIAMGNDIKNKQQYLNCAVSSWNMACLESAEKQKALKQYILAYSKMNPTFTKEDLTDEEYNIHKLIQKKIELYPDVKTQIAGAEIFKIGNKEHITVASIRMK